MDQDITVPSASGVLVPETYTGPTGLSNNITAADLRLPRVALLQSLSPQVQNDGEVYKQGMFINTLTQDILKSPISFVPVFIFKNFIKWRPRNEGGGMVWKTTTPTAAQLKECQFDGANKPTADTSYNAVCLIDGDVTPVVLSFAKTNIKAGQDLTTLAQLSGYAWKYKYTLESVKTTNTKGTFYVMRVKRSLLNENPQEAADLYEQVKGMSIDTDYEGSTNEDISEPTTDEPLEF